MCDLPKYHVWKLGLSHFIWHLHSLSSLRMTQLQQRKRSLISKVGFPCNTFNKCTFISRTPGAPQSCAQPCFLTIAFTFDGKLEIPVLFLTAPSISNALSPVVYLQCVCRLSICAGRPFMWCWSWIILHNAFDAFYNVCILWLPHGFNLWSSAGHS